MVNGLRKEKRNKLCNLGSWAITLRKEVRKAQLDAENCQKNLLLILKDYIGLHNFIGIPSPIE